MSNQQITNKQPHRKKSKYLKDTYSDRENKEKKESAASAPLEADPRSRETEAERADRLRSCLLYTSPGVSGGNMAL